MPNPSLAFALELLDSDDWGAFEEFAAEFLVIRFPNLRTTASPHGDGGRDGQLYVVDEEVKTALQYSVAQDWRAKIRQTVARLAETLPTITELVYATSQRINPDADDLIAELWRDAGIRLDICDRPWFVERELTAPQRAAASEELITLKVKPFLAKRQIIDAPGPALDAHEGRLALLHLTLDIADRAASKGLTRSAFESLVLAALHGTNVDTPVTAEEVGARVRGMIPVGSDQQVLALTASALDRLAKKSGPIHRIGQTDAYHIAFAEEKRLATQTANFLVEEHQVESQLVDELEASTGTTFEADKRSHAGKTLRVGLESILLHKGELFADAAVSGEVIPITAAEILSAVPAGAVPDGVKPAEVASAATETLLRPRDGVRAHLRRLADAYTLFAFLRQAPDVQKTIVKIFSDGNVWLDTSVLLPLFAETLIPNPANRPYTVIFKAAQESGVTLYVTDGVVEEVERHLNRALMFSTMTVDRWRGRLPYIYSEYASSGRPRSAFAGWVEEFRGNVRPEEDVRDYLGDVLKIKNRNLLDLSADAPADLRRTVQEVWAQVHDRRRSRGEDWDQGTIHRLVSHDVENCVGVMQLRRRDRSGTLGYRHWWLTLDRAAFRLNSALRQEFGIHAPMSPALSPDYLVQILRLGPMRTAVETDLRLSLPLLADFSRLDVVPRELISSADSIRESMSGTAEHIIRRRVRDELDTMKSQYSSRAFEQELDSLSE